MSVSQTGRQPDLKAGVYFVTGKTLYYIVEITNDFIIIETCSDNDIRCWMIDDFLKAKKRIIKISAT